MADANNYIFKIMSQNKLFGLHWHWYRHCWTYVVRVGACVCNRRWGFHSPFALGQMEMCLHYCSTKRFSIRMCSTKYVSCLLCQSSIWWPLVSVCFNAGLSLDDSLSVLSYARSINFQVEMNAIKEFSFVLWIKFCCVKHLTLFHCLHSVRYVHFHRADSCHPIAFWCWHDITFYTHSPTRQYDFGCWNGVWWMRSKKGFNESLWHILRYTREARERERQKR